MNHIVVEGAGAVSVASALSLARSLTAKGEGGEIVCVVSGGNVSEEILMGVLRGSV